MAGIGGTLFGIIFLVISIRPELTRSDKSTPLHQFQVASSYTALLNPLVISLFAVVPHSNIGIITTVMSGIGLTNGVFMAISLVQVSMRWVQKVVSGVFIFSSLLLYGFELDYAIRLATTPQEVQSLYSLTTLLVIMYLYGVARAWDLVGMRQFHLFDTITSFVPQRLKDRILETSHKELP